MTQPADFDAPEVPESPDLPGPRRDLSALPAFLRQPIPGAVSPSAAFVNRIASDPPEIRPVVVTRPDPAQLPMVSISPRRIVLIVATVLLAWGVISFGRQVAAASVSSAHADDLRLANGQLSAQVAALQHELEVIQEPRYIDQQARAYRLGGKHEVPFALAEGAPALAPDAPGSSANRLGADPSPGSPQASWLGILFGPGG